jgi:hypothetical protein
MSKMLSLILLEKSRSNKSKYGSIKKFWTLELSSLLDLEIPRSVEKVGNAFLILRLFLRNSTYVTVGTQRRTKKVVHHAEVEEDKKLKSQIKKFGK